MTKISTNVETRVNLKITIIKSFMTKIKKAKK